MSICRCSKCHEIIDSDLTEGCLCEDCKDNLDSMDLEDQLDELL